MIALAQRHHARRLADYAKLIEQAGADALELNVYYVATHPWATSAERGAPHARDACKAVKQAVKIPVAVKLSPFYSSLANFAKQLDEAGADGLVLFNRFYQPDIDVEELEVVPSLQLSDSSELLLRLRWLAILSGHVKGSLACSGGVHTHLDAVKAVMAGAHAVQLVSVLLKHGPQYLATLRRRAWRAGWRSTSTSRSQQMHGSMSHQKSPNPRRSSAPTTCASCRGGNRRDRGPGPGVRGPMKTKTRRGGREAALLLLEETARENGAQPRRPRDGGRWAVACGPKEQAEERRD